MSNNLPNLHDAPLISIHIEWAEKVARLDLEHSWPPIRGSLEFRGLRKFSASLEDEWGPSALVSAVKTEQVDDGVHVVIEMQSGDVIDILANSYELVPR